MPYEFVEIAKESDLRDGEAKALEVGDIEIALCRVDGKFYAVDNICTHADERMAPGGMEGCAIICPRHGAKFDVRNGEVLSMPAAQRLPTFETKVENGKVYVKVDTDE